MDDPISREEKGKWFTELLHVQEEIAAENIKGYMGKTYKVLCDGFGSSEGMMSGHNSGTAAIEFAGSDGLLGSFVNVKIESCEGILKGRII